MDEEADELSLFSNVRLTMEAFVKIQNFDTLSDSALVRLPTVLSVLGVSRTSFYEGLRAGEFPKPVKVGKRSVAWRKSDIVQFIAELPNA